MTLVAGLEDGGGHHGASTLILQPVLQYGKSGCVLNPLSWGQVNQHSNKDKMAAMFLSWSYAH